MENVSKYGTKFGAFEAHFINLSRSSVLEESFTWKDWTRLRDIWSALVSTQSIIQSQTAQLERLVAEEGSFKNHASDLQNRQIKLRILENQAIKAREIIRTTQYRLNVVNAEEDVLRNDQMLLEKQPSILQGQISEHEEDLPKYRTTLKKLQNELIFRRRYMLKELYDIFFPKLQNCDHSLVFQKQCLCLKFDVIRGVHLPTVAARLGHGEVESCAAVSFLVQLLLSVSRILSLPLKHMILFNGSRSSLTNRFYNCESFNLFPESNSKANRDRLDRALYLLNEVPIQIRVDCGVSSRDIDRPIRLLQELLLSFIGEHMFTHSELLVPSRKVSGTSLSRCIAVRRDIMAKEPSASLHLIMPSLPNDIAT